MAAEDSTALQSIEQSAGAGSLRGARPRRRLMLAAGSLRLLL